MGLGGIILLWDDSLVQLSNIQATEFCLSADVHVLNCNNDGDFKITTVYGPTANNRKDDFFAELVAQKPPMGVRWLVLGGTSTKSGGLETKTCLTQTVAVSIAFGPLYNLVSFMK
jgi:hypothetical protein